MRVWVRSIRAYRAEGRRVILGARDRGPSAEIVSAPNTVSDRQGVPAGAHANRHVALAQDANPAHVQQLSDEIANRRRT